LIDYLTYKTKIYNNKKILQHKTTLKERFRMPAKKSVLLFYQINQVTIYAKNFDEIWNNYVSLNSDEARCINAIQFDIPASKLLSLIQERKMAEEVFFDLQTEYEKGANVVFVVPLNASPIGGFFLNKLISH
jgi:hypothetical protein